jgi:hypothetical protein
MWRRAALAGAGLAIAVTVVWAPAYLPDIGALAARPSVAGLGLILGLAGLGLSAIAAAIASMIIVRTRPTWVQGSAVLWAMAAGVVGLAFGIGSALPWQRYEAHIGNALRFSSGSATATRECCTFLQDHGWARGSDISLVVLVVVVLLLFAAMQPSRLAIAGIIGAAIAMIARPLGGLAAIARSASANDFGYSAADVQRGRLTFSHSGLPGLWLALLCPVALGFVAVARGLTARSAA